jgi:hypothetical protein
MSDVRSSPAAGPSFATPQSRATGRGGVTSHGEPTSSGRAMSIVIILLTLGVAVVWSLAAMRQLSSSIVRETAVHLDRARRTFDLTRSRTVEFLSAQARVMVEDPRLKSTLATEGMDEASVADILRDLSKQRGSGFLMVLRLDGRVFAQAGADELRGLDLSGSSAVKKAQGTLEASTGFWVIGGKIMDLSIVPVRYGPKPIDYLVVGQPVDQDLLNSVAEETGVAIATASGQTVNLSAPADDRTKAVFATVMPQLASSQSRLFDVTGETYVVTMSELEESGQSRPRLVVAQSVAPLRASFANSKWLIFAPPFLVIIAVLFALIAGRRTVVVVRQP